MPKSKQVSEERYPLRLEPGLKQAVAEIARCKGTTIRSVIEEALHDYVLRDTAERTDEDLAPLINRLIVERHDQLGSSLRTLIMRLVLEVMRLQYTLFSFMERAGITADELRRWRTDGWPWGYREFRRQPKLPTDEAGP